MKVYMVYYYDPSYIREAGCLFDANNVVYVNTFATEQAARECVDWHSKIYPSGGYRFLYRSVEVKEQFNNIDPFDSIMVQ